MTTHVQGARPDQRVVTAIANLQDQFAICGLHQPIAILVRPGDRQALGKIVRGSVSLLFEDVRMAEAGGLTIWGTAIREEAIDARTALIQLLECAELNQDDIEPETAALIDAAQALLGG
jgi:hypothetical protein